MSALKALGIALAFLAAALAGPAAAQPAAQVTHIYLIQNSGWMLAYYKNPQSGFRPFIEELINATAPAGAKVVIADFNTENQVAGRPSPNVLASGRMSSDVIRQALSNLNAEPPRKTLDPNVLVDSDYAQAIENTALRSEFANSSPAVIWMITNNKYAPDSTSGRLDASVAALTTKFNRSLNADPNVKRIVALIKQIRAPRPPDRGEEFEGRGLVVYGIAYGDDADPILAQTFKRLEDDAVRLGDKALFDRPARLKPLSVQPLNFKAIEIKTAGIEFHYDDQGTLVLENVPPNTPLTIQIVGELSSNYYPQVIDQASVYMNFRNKEGLDKIDSFEAFLSVDKIDRLRPGEKLIPNVELTLKLPAITQEGPFDPPYPTHSLVTVGIKDVSLRLSEEFEGRMKDIFAAERWREVFLDQFQVTRAATEIPIIMTVTYSIWPTIGSLSLVLLALALAGAVVWYLTHEQKIPVTVDGEQRYVQLRPRQTRIVKGTRSSVEVRNGLFGKHTVRPVDPLTPPGPPPTPPQRELRVPRK